MAAEVVAAAAFVGKTSVPTTMAGTATATKIAPAFSAAIANGHHAEIVIATMIATVTPTSQEMEATGTEIATPVATVIVHALRVATAIEKMETETGHKPEIGTTKKPESQRRAADRRRERKEQRAIGHPFGLRLRAPSVVAEAGRR